MKKKRIYYNDILTGRFISKEKWSIQHMYKDLVEYKDKETGKTSNHYVYRIQNNRKNNRKATLQEIQEYKDLVFKKADRVKTTYKKGKSEPDSLVNREFYHFPKIRCDRKKDVDIGLVVSNLFEKYSFNRKILSNLSCYIIVRVYVNDTNFVERSGFINTKEDAYYMTLKVIMSVLRDMGHYIEKSDWRYVKVETKKKKADKVEVSGTLVFQTYKGKDYISLSNEVDADFTIGETKGKKKYIRKLRNEIKLK